MTEKLESPVGIEERGGEGGHFLEFESGPPGY